MERLVYIDTDECIGCESCVEICLEVFGFNPEIEKAEVILLRDRERSSGFRVFNILIQKLQLLLFDDLPAPRHGFAGR